MWFPLVLDRAQFPPAGSPDVTLRRRGLLMVSAGVFLLSFHALLVRLADTAVFSLAFLREAVPARTWLAIGPACFGVALVFGGSVEAVLGPLWAWLILAEVPAALTLLGGGVLLGTLSLHARFALHGRRHARPPP